MANSYNHKGNGNGNSDMDSMPVFKGIGDDFTDLLSLLNIHEEDLSNSGPSDGNNGKYKKLPYEYNKDIWHLGWTDGRYGQPKETNLGIIAANAQLKAGREIESLEQNLADKEAKLACLNYEINYLEPQLTKRRELFEAIWLDKAHNRHLYSIGLAIFFLISAIALFAADIPLTLKLVASGFGVRTEMRIDNINQSINEGLNFSALPYFWEAILLAGGLLFVGIYIKFFLDKLIFREKDEQPLTRNVTGFLVVTMILFLGTFIVLGVFRAEQQDILLREKIARQINNDLIDEEKTNPQFNADPEKRKRTIEQNYMEAKQLQSPWMMPAFVLLTLLFPIIGGLCFSVGFRHIHKVQSFRGIRKDFYKIKKLFDENKLEQNQLAGCLKFERAQLEHKRNNKSRIDSLQKLHENLYLHGYLRGSKMKRTLEEGDSLYERCESLIENKLAEKSREFIWNNQKT